jgi:hypothetical protein
MAARGVVRADKPEMKRTAREAPGANLSNPATRFLTVIDGVEQCGCRLMEFLDRITIRVLLFVLLSYHVAHFLGKIVEPGPPPLQVRESSFYGE